MHARKLASKIEKKQAVIAIVGLGYVGLPLSLRFSQSGFRVIGLDIDSKKVAILNNGESYLQQYPDDVIQNALSLGFKATIDFSEIAAVDAVIICVPTPLDEHQSPNLSYVTQTLDSLMPHIRPGHIISLESTTYPGTTEEEVVPRVAAMGLEVGEDCFVVYSPEREDPGNRSYSTKSIPKLVGGITQTCLKMGALLYGSAVEKVVPVSSCRTAEMTKLVENVHRAVNIALVNELKMVAESMDIDIFEVINAAATKPFGFVPYYPGPGLGGHCIPIDPYYLTWKAKEYGMQTKFIELASTINNQMPVRVVEKVTEALNSTSQSLRGSTVLILGVSYKPNVDDARESPSLKVMELLIQAGVNVRVSDPHISSIPPLPNCEYQLDSVPLTTSELAESDCVCLLTHHDQFDYDLIETRARLIVDARGKFSRASAKVFPA
jgi:UDP-N-acetyl-D-glucosamine dehydrogenase